jgi:hypothetical protein
MINDERNIVSMSSFLMGALSLRLYHSIYNVKEN